MKKIIKYCLLIVLVMSSINFFIHSYSESFRQFNLTNDVKIKNIRLNNDINIQGVFGGYTFFFDTSKYWEVTEGSYFELIFSQSDIKDYMNSTLTIYLNDFPLKSILLNEKTIKREHVKVPILKDIIKEGYNEISIKIYHRITDEPCKDVINPANWIVFHKESYVHLEFLEKKDSYSISDYPYPYLKISRDGASDAVILISDYFFSHELTAIMKLATNFGQRFKFEDINIDVYKFSDKKNLDNKNVIFIGSVKNTPKEILSKLSEEELKWTNDGALIKEIESPYDKDYKLLLILSQKKEYLLNAINALSKDSVIKQMTKNRKFITEIIDINDNNVEQDIDKIALKDLKYSNALLEGLFFQEVNFGISIPKNWEIIDGAKLVLKMRYSEALNFERSSVTIYINNIPIGSKKLVKENADNYILEIELPEDVRKSTYYNLKVRYYLENKDFDCSFIGQENSWAFIRNDSYLYLPHKDRKKAFLENYPNPFIKDNKLKILVVLSDTPSSSEISIAANISAFLGHETKRIDEIEVLSASEFRNINYDKNIIAIGIPKNNQFIKKLNDKLYIKFDESFSRFISNEKIKLLGEYSENLASIQLIDSPYSKGRQILIVTATNEVELKWAEKFLAEFEYAAKLKGDAIIIDRSGNINWAYYSDKKDKEEIDIEKEIIENKKNQKEIMTYELKMFIIFVIMTLGIIIVSSIFILRRNRRKD